MKNWIRKYWMFVLGLVISAVFVYSAARKLEWDAFFLAIRSANYWWLIPGVGMYLIGLWVRAWRWHYLLRPVKPVSTKVMFPIVTIGYMGNNVYPARAGEILRAVILKRREGVPISASFATIIVERIFDGVVMLAFIFVNLGELSRLTSFSIPVAGFDIGLQDLAVWGSIAFFGALVVFLLAAMFPKITERLLAWGVAHFLPEKLRPNVMGVSMRFLNGLESLRSPLEALMIFLTSVVIWLLETGKYWFVMHAFDFSVGFFGLMLMNGVVNLAITLPGAPGYVGTFDAPGIAVLSAYGVDVNVAAGYTVVLHVALWVVPTLLGAYYLAREGIGWRGKDIEKLKDEG
ncbi:MAG: lysylphosphatidylglycerol synthase transmembrane domain-containing protein [Chloroflexota bacterium]